MRHRISYRKLNRTSAHRRAMQRNLAQSLFEHGQVRTTLPKAKDLRPFAERLITLAKKSRAGNITARRRIHKLLGDRSLIPAQHRETSELMPPAKRRRTLRSPSGRRLPDRRVGDHSPLAIVQLVGDEKGPGVVTKPGKTARRKRADARYAAAIKAGKGAARKRKKGAAGESAEASGPEPADQTDESPAIKI